MGLRSRLKSKPILAGALIGALAAFIMAAAGHFRMWMQSSDSLQSTGATQGLDLWTYYSMARAVWRSPNGITYSYPYDLYWPTPPIAFQLPITLLAWIGRITGIPAAFEVGRIAGGAGSGAAIAAIGLLFPAGFWRRWFYIAAVLGGGFFSLAAVVLAIQNAGWPGLTELWYYQRNAEDRIFWWLPYLVRNLRMPLECLYHAMVIGALACLAWRRYAAAWVLGLAVWMSNPFSAVALHAAVLPWYCWRVWETHGPRRRRFLLHLAAWVAVNILAVLYYGWFLNRWIAFRELNTLYKIQYQAPLEWWRVLLLIFPYAAGIVSALLVPSLRRAVWGRPVWRLFALLAAAHLFLLQQSFFLGTHSMQAFHYNRGYLHLGLVAVAWRVIMVLLRRRNLLHGRDLRNAWWPRHFQNSKQRLVAWLTCAIVGVTCMDQVLFFWYTSVQPRAVGMIWTDYAEIVQKIPTSPAPMLVYTEPMGLPGSYVTAYSPHIAWQAPESMVVPFYNERISLFDEAREGMHGGVAGLGIDYAILYRDNKQYAAALEQQAWTIAAESELLLLYRAPNPVPEQNPSPDSISVIRQD